MVGFSNSKKKTSFKGIVKGKEKIPRKLALSKPVLIESNTKYTVELDQSGGNTYHMGDASKTMSRKYVSVNGVTVTFTTANFSPNGTVVNYGHIPCLYLANVL